VADAQRLADAAAARDVVASVFHNRRWDGDFLTLRRLVSEGSLGDLVRLESRFDRWRPEVDQSKWREGGGPEDAGGVLFDLGPHLIDQALDLLGPARSVYAEVRRLRPGARVDDDVFLALEHSSGALSHLSATMLAAQPGPQLRALGSRAAYIKWGLDVQEQALRDGARPGDAGFGEDPRETWGLLGTEEDASPVETAPGRYVEFYERMETAIRSGEPPPVPLEAGIATLRVIEAAQASAAQHAVVSL
jgi:predicted dehydrogenase